MYKFPYTGGASSDSPSTDPVLLTIHESNLVSDMCKHTVKIYVKPVKLTSPMPTQ
jgi:hypothetical protein